MGNYLKINRNSQRCWDRQQHTSARTLTCLSFCFCLLFSHFSFLISCSTNFSFSVLPYHPPPEHPTSCSLICLVVINCWRIYWVARRLKSEHFLFFIFYWTTQVGRFDIVTFLRFHKFAKKNSSTTCPLPLGRHSSSSQWISLLSLISAIHRRHQQHTTARLCEL